MDGDPWWKTQDECKRWKAIGACGFITLLSELLPVKFSRAVRLVGDRGHNPVGVESNSEPFSQGRPLCGQPWALGQNPFGIRKTNRFVACAIPNSIKWIL